MWILSGAMPPSPFFLEWINLDVPSALVAVISNQPVRYDIYVYTYFWSHLTLNCGLGVQLPNTSLSQSEL